MSYRTNDAMEAIGWMMLAVIAAVVAFIARRYKVVRRHPATWRSR